MNKNKITLFLIFVTAILIMPSNISAAYSDWMGYTTTSTKYSKSVGWNSGSFYIHLAKNGVKYSSTYIPINVVTSCGSASRACWDKMANGSQRYKVYTVGNDVKIGTSGTKYKGYNVNFDGNKSDTTFPVYIGPWISIKIPKGYKFGSHKAVSDPSVGKSASTQMYPYNTNTRGSVNNSLFASSVGKSGPYASDTWVSGYFDLSVQGTGLLTTSYRRTYQSYNLNFVPNVCTITFNGNGNTGGSTANQSVTYNTNATIKENGYTRTGYTFNGWNTNANGTGTNYSVGQNVTTTFPTQTSLTLYAKWVPNTYTVKFDANGGRGTMEDQVFTYDISQKLRPNEYDRPNYKFIEWNTEPDGTGTSYTSNQEILNLTATNNAKIRLYAQWIEDVPLIITDGGEEVEKDNSGNYVLKNKRSTGKLKICKDIIQG